MPTCSKIPLSSSLLMWLYDDELSFNHDWLYSQWPGKASLVQVWVLVPVNRVSATAVAASQTSARRKPTESWITCDWAEGCPNKGEWDENIFAYIWCQCRATIAQNQVGCSVKKHSTQSLIYSCAESNSRGSCRLIASSLWICGREAVGKLPLNVCCRLSNVSAW